MWLIDTATIRLVDFSCLVVPPYAILSHTWTKDEITFQDMVSIAKALDKGDQRSSIAACSKQGFAKITNTCKLARWNGLKYAWVDTCCIDKSSSAELTEAINSMYQWYLKAVACFVYLVDLAPDSTPEDALPNCRWFSRGWYVSLLI
jgi:hypothetical protein